MKKKCEMRDLSVRNSLLKILSIMKFTIFFLLIFVSQLSASLYSQQTKLKVDFNQATIKEVIDEIEKQTGLTFFFSGDVLDIDQLITLKTKSMSIDDILELVSKQTGLSLTVVRDQILVKKVNPAIESFQQQKTISGKVTDTSGQPLPGVTVIEKGTTLGTITNADGEYSIANITPDAILQFSFVGMKAQEVVIGNKTRIEVRMEEETIGIDEVVAIGYSMAKRSELTSAISSVKQESIRATSVATLGQALQGKTAGVEVYAGSNSPGSDPSVRIRGISSINNTIQPLYVLDGIPLSGTPSFLSNNDIASVDILKDAAAASIYGSRGANGVIIITTIKGNTNQKVKIDINVSYGFQNPAKFMKPMRVQEYARMRQAFVDNDGSGVLVSSEHLKLKGTDWIDEVVNENAPLQNYSVTLSGGGANHSYSSSINYYAQEGVAILSDFKRLNARLNLTQNVLGKLKIGQTIVFTNKKRKAGADSGMWGGLFTNALSIDPITPVYKTQEELNDPAITPNSNKYSIYHAGIYSTSASNPVGQASRYINDGHETTIFISAFGSYEIIKGLTFKSTIGYEYGSNSDWSFTPTYWESPTENNTTNSIDKNTGFKKTFTSENTLTFSTRFGDNHSLTILGGQSFQRGETRGTSVTGTELPGDEPNYWSVNMALNKTGKESYDKWALSSYFSRIVYNYKSKYYLAGSVRADGSSKFAPGNKWGIFPAVSAGWILSNEDFFRLDDISLLKFRFGWGKIGNQAIPSQSYDSFLRNDYYYQFDDATLTGPGYALQSPGNPDIKWETTTDFNLGLDFGVLKNKINGTIDVYKRKITDMLLGVEAPMFTGVYAPNKNAYSNVGSIENKGIDLALNFNSKIRKLEYNIGTSFSIVRNEVLDLGPLPFLDSPYPVRNVAGAPERTVVGRSIGEFYGYEVLGVFQNQTEIDNYVRNGKLIQPNARPGDFKFGTNPDNVDGTTLSENDKQFLGSAIPKFSYGLNFNFKYKGFDLSADFYGVHGNKVFNVIKVLYGNTNNNSTNWISGLVDDAWHGEGTSNSIPKITTGSNNNNFGVISDNYLENGSYFRCQNLNLGYEFNPSVCSKFDLTKLRLYVGVQNLFTITQYGAFDPSVSDSDVLQVGTDFNGYPLNRTVTIGCNIIL